MQQVVSLLAADLGHELGERLVRGPRERLEPHRIGRLVQLAPGDGERPVGPRVVDQPGVTQASGARS